MITISIIPKNLEDTTFLRRIEKLFTEICCNMNPITGCVERSRELSKKRKISGRATDPEEEFSGIFWLNYFCDKYVETFGKEKFNALYELDYAIKILPDKSNIFRCGNYPCSSDSILLRGLCEKFIGKHYFVDIYSDNSHDKLVLPKYSNLI